MNIIFGVLGSALVTAVMIFIFSFFDDTINSTDQVERVLGLPVLGVIFEHQGSSGVISRDDPLSPTSEAFRTLRTNVQQLNIHSLLITSAIRDTGKSLVSANLAVILAQSDIKVILTDVDLRRPAVHRYMGLKNESGITNLLLKPTLSVKKVLQKTDNENLFVITSGDLPPNPSELLGSQRMAKLVDEFKESANIIIYDAPPILPVADAAVMATMVDGVILIIRPGKTTLAEARQTIKSMQRVNAKVVGVVFNGVKMKGPLYFYYYRKMYGKYQSDYFAEIE